MIKQIFTQIGETLRTFLAYKLGLNDAKFFTFFILNKTKEKYQDEIKKKKKSTLLGKKLLRMNKIKK